MGLLLPEISSLSCLGRVKRKGVSERDKRARRKRQKKEPYKYKKERKAEKFFECIWRWSCEEGEEMEKGVVLEI
ncbi:hypothetical protein AMTR_s00073p00032280 [Amborella trichopoda]|uniref:Uncharacterized protein n=1 Tax=Amborella trichopoda TaxID=13333 RepID=W1NRH6_AMBTC|nr:hypothetical protein AMTR_s00073p00032280 [Amborella trichopoda]